MNAPDKIFIAYPSDPPAANWTESVHIAEPKRVEYIRNDLHQSALADRDATIARLQDQVVEAVKMLIEQDFEYNRKTNDMIERHAKKIDRLQARLDAGPTVEDVRQWGEYWKWPDLIETANRMEAANGE